MRLEIRIEGNLEEIIRADLLAGSRAASRAMARVSAGLKNELRSQIVGAGLGPRLARTWRSQKYPQKTDSLGAAGVVWSNAPDVVRAFDQGVTIRAKNGKFLAIPTAAAKKIMGLGRGGSIAGRKRIRPDNWPYQRFGRLRLVAQRRGPALLVADGLRAHTGARSGRHEKAKRGGETVVMFILLPTVRLRKRLDIAAAAQRWHAALPGIIAEEWGSV